MIEDTKITEIFERATAICRKIPSNLQEVAFNRALDIMLSDKQLPNISPTSKKRKKNKGTFKKDSDKRKPLDKEKKRSISSHSGPKAALENLLDKPFWKQARTIRDLQTHLRDNTGFKYEVTDLSPALLRLLRDGKIDRNKNKENQYEYKPR